ncbi:MAG TPA: SDR family oxidoreductase [Nevskiales bacterium]|nr:SDR family oxidoreductase [Nevskiales bacterium]
MRIRSLNGMKCLVTGAASGIGRAVAEQAAAEGAVLFLADIDAARLEAVADGIRQRGGQLGLVRAFDISDYEAVRGFARDIHAGFGSLDVLMNIAGISVWGAVEKLDHQDWRRCVDINLMGPIHVIECFVPEMIRAGRGGWLVNVSSAAGLFGLPWHAAYSASKFGLRGVSEVLRFDLKRHGIGVSLVCPGGVDTGLVQTVEIRGVDTATPEFRGLKKRFQKQAATPAHAARLILKGMKAGRYMIFTSFDVRLGYWIQRKFAWPYEWVMQFLNNRLHDIAKANQQAPRNV